MKKFSFLSPITDKVEANLLPPGLMANHGRTSFAKDNKPLFKSPIDVEIDRLIRTSRPPRIDIEDFGEKYGLEACPYFVARYWALRGITNALDLAQREILLRSIATKRLRTHQKDAATLLDRLNRFQNEIAGTCPPQATAHQASASLNEAATNATIYEKVASDVMRLTTSLSAFTLMVVDDVSERHITAGAKLLFARNMGIGWRILTNRPPGKSNPFRSFVTAGWLSIPGTTGAEEMHWERACDRAVADHNIWWSRLNNHAWKLESSDDQLDRQTRIASAHNAISRFRRPGEN